MRRLPQEGKRLIFLFGTTARRIGGPFSLAAIPTYATAKLQRMNSSAAEHKPKSPSGLSRFTTAAVCLFVPLIVLSFFPPLASPFFATKHALLLIFAGLIAATTLGTLAANKITIAPQYRSLVRGFLLSAMAFAAATLLAAATSPLRYMSRSGILTALATTILLVVLPLVLRGREVLVLKSVAIAAVLVAYIAILQSADLLDLFRLFGRDSGTFGRMRIYATLGNPNFVATFLAASISSLFALHRRSSSARMRVALVFGMVLITTATVLTGSRAGIAALAFAVVAFLWTSTSNRKSRWITSAIIAVLTILIIGGSELNPRALTEAARGRLFIWRAALSGDQSLLTGSGPNTFAYLYLPRAGSLVARHPEAARFVSYELHAQNDWVETFLETGTVGLIALVAIFVFWFRHAFRVLREGSAAREITTAAISGIVALVVSSVLDFPFHRAEGLTLLCIWMSLPVAQVLKLHARERSGGRFRYALIPVALVLVVSFTWLGTRPLVADALVARGEQFESAGFPSEASEAYRHALQLDPTSTNAQFDLVRSLASDENFLEALTQSQQLLRFVSEPECWMLRSRILRRLGDSQTALNEIRAATHTFPFSTELQDELNALTTTSVH